jgi:hypothetical protein
MGPLLSYKENEVLRIWSLVMLVTPKLHWQSFVGRNVHDNNLEIRLDNNRTTATLTEIDLASLAMATTNIA